MGTYYRLQVGHYTIEAMQAYVSEDGGDDGGTEGICACTSGADLLRNTVWDAASIPGAEVVVLVADRICEIYDGYRVFPVEIVGIYSPAEFATRVGEGEFDWS